MRPRRVGILVHDGVTMIDVAGPADVASHANAVGGKYQPLVISVDGEDVTAENGLTIAATTAAAEVPNLDVLIVPGAYGMIAEPFDPALLSAVGTLAMSARRIAGVRTGAFLLAELGLLDAHRATTHWTRLDDFQKRYHRVIVERNALFVADRGVYTSAGISSGVDLMLAIVEQDLGPAPATKVARQLVLATQRGGDAQQLPARLLADPMADSPLAPLLSQVADAPARSWSLDELAAVVHLSLRAVTRRFRDELGTTPARWVEAIRVDRARAALEQGEPVAVAAALAGFRSTETMRRVFWSRIGLSPAVYRERAIAGEVSES